MKINRSHTRHIVKAVTYRFFGSAATFIIGWIITGNVAIGVSISSIDFFTKIVLYYLHERAWHKSSFGIKNTNNIMENS